MKEWSLSWSKEETCLWVFFKYSQQKIIETEQEKLSTPFLLKKQKIPNTSTELPAAALPPPLNLLNTLLNF